MTAIGNPKEFMLQHKDQIDAAFGSRAESTSAYDADQAAWRARVEALDSVLKEAYRAIDALNKRVAELESVVVGLSGSLVDLKKWADVHHLQGHGR